MQVYGIIAYKFISCGNVATLERRVNEEIVDGWEPQGGPLVYRDDDQRSYDQAMVKRVLIEVT